MIVKGNGNANLFPLSNFIIIQLQEQLEGEWPMAEGRGWPGPARPTMTGEGRQGQAGTGGGRQGQAGQAGHPQRSTPSPTHSTPKHLSIL